MTPGVSGDGWWTGEDLVKQVQEKAIPIFEERFPGAIGVFAFDNATSHSVFAPDALVAKRINLSSKEKQLKMRYDNYVTGILSFYANYILFFRFTTFGNGILQDIVFSLDYSNVSL